MPFSSVLGASSVIKPGVCTSTTRPTVPYTGQLIYETDTAKVASWNGSAWVYTATGGLVLLRGETSFSAVASITVDNVFSATYRNYKLLITYTTTAANVDFRVRAGGASVSTTTYNIQRLLVGSTTVSATRGSSQTSFGAFTTSGNIAAAEMTIYQPFIATPTNFTVSISLNDTGYTAPDMIFRTGNNSNSTSYDGFELLVSSGTMTGTYAVYGMALS